LAWAFGHPAEKFRAFLHNAVAAILPDRQSRRPVSGKTIESAAFWRKSQAFQSKTYGKSHSGDGLRARRDFSFAMAGHIFNSPPDAEGGRNKSKGYIMKNLLLASALVAVSGFGAVAQEAPVALSASITSQIMSLVPDADLSGLTNVQYAQLVSLFANSDNLSSGSNPSGAIKAIINAQ
jgi:hypothetical protein